MFRSIVLIGTRGQPANIAGVAQYLLLLGSVKVPDLQNKGNFSFCISKVLFKLIKVFVCSCLKLSFPRGHFCFWVPRQGRSFATAMGRCVGMPEWRDAGLTGKVHSPVSGGILLSTSKSPSHTDGCRTPEKISKPTVSLYWMWTNNTSNKWMWTNELNLFWQRKELMASVQVF